LEQGREVLENAADEEEVLLIASFGQDRMHLLDNLLPDMIVCDVNDCLT
jgi:hypothetical protein